MRVRKILAIICYTVCLLAYGVCGYISYLSWETKITHRFGFLLFLPVWIIAFWFSTFFTQLVTVRTKDGSNKVLIGKKVRNILNDITSLISVVLLVVWAYMVYQQYRATGTFL